MKQLYSKKNRIIRFGLYILISALLISGGYGAYVSENILNTRGDYLSSVVPDLSIVTEEI